MFVVENLLRSIDANLGEEVGYGSAVGGGLDLDLSSAGKPGRQQLRQADDVVGLFAGQAQRVRVLFVEELQRQDAHANEVGTVYALVAFGDHGAHAKQQRSLG